MPYQLVPLSPLPDSSAGGRVLSVLVDINPSPERGTSAILNNRRRNSGSGSTSVPSDAPSRWDLEESEGRWRRGEYYAKAGEHRPPLLPVLLVDPI